MDALRPTTTYGQDTQYPFFVWSDKRGAAVAHVFVNSAIPPSENDPEQVELTRLFAAAPDLLAACVDLVQLWDSWAEHSTQLAEPLRTSIKMRVDQARAAIAKAKGE